MKAFPVLLYVCALAGAWQSGATEAASTTARFVWQQVLSGHEQDLRSKDAAVDGHGNAWLLLTVRPKGALLTHGSLALWRLGPDGDRDRAFAVALPAQHGALSNADEPAFVRISLRGNPVVAARTHKGVSVVELNSADGVLVNDWLVDGSGAPVALTTDGPAGLTMATADQLFALHAGHPPRAMLHEALPAHFVAALGVRDRIALVAATVDPEQGNQVHVGFVDRAQERMPSLVATRLDVDAALSRNISYARDRGLDILAPLKSARGSWRRLSFDAGANLAASQRFEVPAAKDLPRTLDALPLAGGSVLLAGAQDATFWLARLHDTGAVVPIALAPVASSRPHLPMFALDVRLRATANPREFVLLATQVSGNTSTRRHDYGLFAAKVALSAPQ